MGEIIAALVTAGLGLVGVIVTNAAANRKMLQGIDVANAITTEKIAELERKVEKHNQVMERTYKLEGRMTEAEHDIRDLKGKVS